MSLKISFRRALREPLFAALNIVGLIAGLLFCALIAAHLWSERQIDRGSPDGECLVFLASDWRDPNMGMEITSLGPLGSRLKAEFPQLVADFYRWDGITAGISHKNRPYREGIQIGDSTLFSMFGWPLRQGDAATAMREPFTAVVTERMAEKIFGRKDALGESMTVENFAGGKAEFRIAGVLKNLPENSVSQLLGNEQNEIFIPPSAAQFFNRTPFDSWQNAIVPTYLKLQKGVAPAALDGPIRSLVERSGDAFLAENFRARPVPLADFYFEKNGGAARKMARSLAMVGLFILGMAVVNFVNLSVAASAGRIREMGVRKAIGGQKRQLFGQVLSESMLFSTVSTIAAVGLFPIAAPFFEKIVGKKLPALLDFPLVCWLAPVVFSLGVGLLAGVWPALRMATLPTVDSLRGRLRSPTEAVGSRRVLVGFQFAVAHFAVIAAAVVAMQVDLFFGKNLGFDHELVLSAQVPRDWTAAGVRKMKTVRDELEKMPEIRSVSLSFEIPNGNSSGEPPFVREGRDTTQGVLNQLLVVDEKFGATYGLGLTAGRFFEGSPTDSGTVVLNEAAVRAFDFETPEAAIGQRVRMLGSSGFLEIRGVFRDFHFSSMHRKIQPIVAVSNMTRPIFRFLSIKIEPTADLGASLLRVEKRWAELLPGAVFNWSFFDDSLAKIYRAELQTKRAALAASVLAMIVALLGAVGLAVLSAQRRAKEIGVRKVLGASVAEVIWLFLKEFAFSLALATAVAAPVAVFFLKKWLGEFAYRVELRPAVFVGCAAAVAAVSLAVVAAMIARAALADPVKSLRSE